MLYVGIDLHKKSLTVCVRSEQGDIVLRRQVSTNWLEVDRFLTLVRERSAPEGGYIAVLEVCGFHDWLVKRLDQAGCSRTCVIAASPPSRNKTDRRDAAKLSELLWINRHRLVAGTRLNDMRLVYQPTPAEEHARQLTHLRWRLGRDRTRIANQISHVILRHNLAQECPTKGLFTGRSLDWMDPLSLQPIARLALDTLLEHYRAYSRQIKKLDQLIVQAADQNSELVVIRTLPRLGKYTALALWAHIGPIARFPSPKSMANYFGITPGCRNSGENSRPGSITKAGHPLVRFLLAQFVVHALRADPGLREWYRKIKRRRGSKIARVAVMRRLCEALWHMLTRQEAYRPMAA